MSVKAEKSLIEPRTLRGFRDFLPEMMLAREQLIEISRRVYRSFGFAPIDTPALEYFEILSGKGGEESDRQLYQFADQGDRHVGMRFDLTVPLARFVAQHANELGFPFKRYHIGTVWRGENPQDGRYREFMQSDFDTIGTTSVASDVETALVIHDLMRAIGFERFQVRISNRKILNGILQKLDLFQHAAAILRAIDKLPKIGRDKVRQEIEVIAPGSPTVVEQILSLVELRGSNRSLLEEVEKTCRGNDLSEHGYQELYQMVECLERLEIHQENVCVDLSIARGLDYYTGAIYETFLLDLPGIGSICSGGRYDNLAQLFTRLELPGVGASLGLDRLIAAMERLGMLPKTKTPADVLITQFDSQFLPYYFQLADWLRKAGFGVEVFPDPKKLGQQFKYASRRGFSAALVLGPEELANNKIQLKWLADGHQTELSSENQGAAIAQWLAERVERKSGFQT